jgi:hypothetical protein
MLVGSPLRAEEGPRLGAWSLTSTGNSGGQWSASFELKKTDNEYTGAFHLNSEGTDAGTESFRGMYDSSKQEIVLHGVAAKDKWRKRGTSPPSRPTGSR